MKRDKDHIGSSAAINALRFEQAAAAMLTLLLFALGSAIIVVTIHDGKVWVLPGVFLVSVLLLGVQHLERREKVAGWNERIGSLVILFLITAVTFLIYIPTLRVYFISDDFGCLHAFHMPSLGLFIEMFHTDLAHLVEGENGEEIRPFFYLFYMFNFGLWGLNPVGYHLTGLLAHIFNSILVFAIANEVAPGNKVRAGIAGLLFAVQPLDSMAVSWIAGAPAEEFPAFFYLLSFFSFSRYRTTWKGRYLWLSILSFAACLISKETAVTLPVMLFFYDLFRRLEGKFAQATYDGAIRENARLRAHDLLPHLPFWLLLLGYLEWRHIVFRHFLAENNWASLWNSGSNAGLPGQMGILHEFAVLLRNLGGEQVFILRALLLSLPMISLVLVLSLYLTWAVQLLRNQSEGRQSVRVILCFALVWFLISELPLLVATPDARHLYLPNVGPCIAIAFLAMPTSYVLRKGAGYSRLIGVMLLVILLGIELRRENSQLVEAGDTLERVTTQMAGAIGAMPEQALAIVQSPGGVFLPFVLQPPFTSTDLYQRMQIIEWPGMNGSSPSEWWSKTRRILAKELSGAPDDSIEVNFLVWDESSESFRQSRRMIPRRVIQAKLRPILGADPGTLESVTDQQADGLVAALVELDSPGS